MTISITGYTIGKKIHETSLKSIFYQPVGEEDPKKDIDNSLKENNSNKSNNQDISKNQRKNIIDKKVEELLIQFHKFAKNGKMEDCIRTGIKGLSLLGIKLSFTPGKYNLFKETIFVKKNLGKRTIKDLIDAPKLEDPAKKIALKLLIEMITPSYLTGNSNLFTLIVLKAINLSLRYGNIPESAYAYVIYGVLATCELGDFKAGYEFGKLAISINANFQDIELKARVTFLYTVLIHHWNNHLSTLTPLLENGIEAGYQSKDKFYLARNAQHCGIWDTKLDLGTSCKKQKKYLSKIKECNYQDVMDSATLYLQMCLNFRDLTYERFSMNDSIFDELQCLKRMTQRNNIAGIAAYHLHKMEIHFFYYDYSESLRHIQEVDKIIQSLMGQPFLARFSIISFLSFAGQFDCMNSKIKKKTSKRMQKEYEQMKKWANHCPDNFLHLQLIMEAEKDRLSKNYYEASALFVQAIKTAKENKHLRDEALANEMTAKLYIEIGQEKAAEGYLCEALSLYIRWGANRKVNHLREKYPHLLPKEEKKKEDITTKDLTSTYIASRQEVTEALDFDSVIKVSQAISEEIRLEALLKKMMKVVVENAGAQRVMYISNSNSTLSILSEVGIDGIYSFHKKNILIEQAENLAKSIVFYSARVNKSIFIYDASRDSQFSKDEYIRHSSPKSILCSPIVRQKKLIGLLYLENNISTGTFTKNHLKTLNLLSSQMAISIENAYLYETLDQKVRLRTKQLIDKNQKITASINYAQQIQKSILPSAKEKDLYLPNSFILFEPRDIVGGDFYKFFKIEDGFIIILADCTGHGVPGGFMTMLSASALRSIIHEEKQTDPGMILTRLNQNIKKSLRQEHKQSTTASDDGLEGAVCVIRPKEKKLLFAGARFPLIIIEKGEITKIKGDRSAIGYKKSKFDFYFTTKEISISNEQTFYMFTDGIVDQPGGHRSFQYSTKQLITFFITNHDKPFDQQKKLLIKSLFDWQGNQTRRDDVTVIGFKVENP